MRDQRALRCNHDVGINSSQGESNIHLPCSRALIEVHVDADRNGRRRPRPFLAGRSDSASAKRKWRRLSHQWPAVSQFPSLLSLICSLGAGRILKGGKSNSVRGPGLSLRSSAACSSPFLASAKFFRSHELGPSLINVLRLFLAITQIPRDMERE